MNAPAHYLRPQVCAKPLVNGWIATEQHIPPVQAALNIKNVQAELLRSYLDAPDYHWKAAHTPALMGGPWVNVEPARAGEVEALLSRLERERGATLAFARAIEELDAMVQSEATGAALRPLYARIPELLRGYVELVYDIDHHASLRFIEALLYRSSHYDPSLQTIALTLVEEDRRPYQYATPWLADDAHVHLDIPFADERLDRLFEMRTAPRQLGEILEILGDALGPDARDAQRMRGLFTDAPPTPPAGYEGPGVRIRYFGHACLLIQTRQINILTDPIISYRYPSDCARYTFEDLPERLDYVVLTHYHKDHVYIESLLQLRHRTAAVVIPKNVGGHIQDPSFKQMLQRLGFSRIVELDHLESLDLPGGSVTALPFLGEHCDLDIRSKAAHLIRLEGKSLLCAADSDNMDPMLYRHLRDEVGAIDALFLGMECVGAPMSSVYGGLMVRPLSRKNDHSRRTTGSNYESAIGIVDTLSVKRAYIYAMGLEPWLNHILPLDPDRDSQGLVDTERFIAECRRRGIESERPYCQKEILL